MAYEAPMTTLRYINLDIIEELFEENFAVTASSGTSWVVEFTSGEYAGYKLTLTGEGFGGLGALPITGTINSLSLFDGPTARIDVTGLSLPALKLVALADLEDAEEHDEDDGDQDDDYVLGGDSDDDIDGGLGDDDLDGGEGNDDLDGGDGDDDLDGGAGDDTLTGGAGEDLVNYANAQGSITINLAKGWAKGHGQDILSSIEDILGSDFADTLFGSNAANDLDGGAGEDRLSGGKGKDDLDGGVGDDILEGGAGKDFLSGGAGRDKFVFKTLLDSKVTASGRDVITDFQRGDKIDLSAIDANSTLKGNQKFKFVKDFTGLAGEVQWDKAATGFTISGDINGDSRADFSVQVNTSLKKINSFDFVL